MRSSNTRPVLSPTDTGSTARGNGLSEHWSNAKSVATSTAVTEALGVPDVAVAIDAASDTMVDSWLPSPIAWPIDEQVAEFFESSNGGVAERFPPNFTYSAACMYGNSAVCLMYDYDVEEVRTELDRKFKIIKFT